jgi:hypothetical protein
MKLFGAICGICTAIFVLAYWLTPNATDYQGWKINSFEFALLAVIAAGIWTIAGLLYQQRGSDK